jgi:hypothetical protein
MSANLDLVRSMHTAWASGEGLPCGDSTARATQPLIAGPRGPASWRALAWILSAAVQRQSTP